MALLRKIAETMFWTLIAAGMDCTLLAIVASTVIGLRLEMIAKGSAQSQFKSELMVSEKLNAFAQTRADLLSGVSTSIVRGNFRAVIRANEVRLKAIRSAA